MVSRKSEIFCEKFFSKLLTTAKKSDIIMKLFETVIYAAVLE